jgi:hypothetical protein
MGFLIRNQYTDAAPLPDYTSEKLFGSVTPVNRWEDIEEYMLIVQTNAQSGARKIVGASSTEIRKHRDAGTTSTYRAKVLLEGQVSPLLPKAVVKVSGYLNEDVNLTAFHGEAALGPLTFVATGSIVNNMLYVKTVNANKTNLLKRPFQNNLSLAEALRPALGNQMEIKPGNQMTAPVLDPLTGRNRGMLRIVIGEKETLGLNGQDIETYRVTSSIGDLETVMWVDAEGKTVRRQLVGGLAMERTTREEALKVAPSLDAPVEVPQLDYAEFRGVPIEREGDASSGGGSIPGMNMLESLLK